MDKSKLRPATPADLVEGNKIIVEDAAGVFVKGIVTRPLSAAMAGIVHIHESHTYGSEEDEDEDVEEDYGWAFREGDFEDGRHGDYGLTLWVQTGEAEDTFVDAINAAVEKATAAWLDGKERATGLALAAATAAINAYRAERAGGKS